MTEREKERNIKSERENVERDNPFQIHGRETDRGRER